MSVEHEPEPKPPTDGELKDPERQDPTGVIIIPEGQTLVDVKPPRVPY